MRMIFQRAILPVVLLAMAVASLVYGFGYHTETVVEERQVETRITIPSPFSPPPVPGGPDFGGPGGPSFMGPPPIVEIVKQTIRTAKEEPESRLNFEVSIGGLAINQSGELKRTYAGKAPSLCPS